MLVASAISLPAQHQHDHDGDGPKLAPPKVFLDKSPRVVAYQLKRLDNQRLLMVERKTDDEKYIPVYSAILTRVGMTPQFRVEAVQALAKLTDSDPVTVLLDGIQDFDPAVRDQLHHRPPIGNDVAAVASRDAQVPSGLFG